jgi:hypothetical protein
MFLGDSSGEDFEGFNIARSSKDILATLSDAPQANLISKLTEDDAKDWIDIDTDTFLVEEFTMSN